MNEKPVGSDLERRSDLERQRNPLLPDESELGTLISTKDWSSTPLGAPENWSPALRMMTSVLLANRFPLLLWWGPEYISIYNDAYRPILGTKHPWALGQPVSECWKEIWHILRPLIDTPFKGGPATWMEDLPVEINRHGFVEETHFTVAYSPVPDDTAPRGIGGVLATVHEITEKVVAERRVRILRDVGSRTSDAKTAEEACAIAAKALATHDRDVPFALLYLIDPDGKQARLAGVTDEMDQAIGPAFIDLDEDHPLQRGWPFIEALRKEDFQVVDDIGSLFDKIPSGPWSDSPHQAVVMPFRASTAHSATGILVAGISPRLKLDEQYRSFLVLLTTQLATAIANARAYEVEKKRAEALAELDRAKTVFFSNVSHEFRTPLTLMLGPLEEMLAKSSGLSSTNKEQLEITHRNALRLLRLVNTMLDFSRVAAGRVEAVYRPTDLPSLTRDLASAFRSACEKAGLTLAIDTAPLPKPVFVDDQMWEKIVLNLISNAFKFTFDGGIRVALSVDDDHAVLRVSDTGIGIPDTELPQVFDRFHRVSGARGRTHEGTGIGLALVKELVELHKGAVSVESTPGKGTIFTVRLPFGSAHLPQDHLDAMRTQASTETIAEAYVNEALRWLPDSSEWTARDEPVPAQRHASGGQARILIADDNADMRSYLARLLSVGYQVTTVGDGEQALTAARRARPDLILTDVMMPQLDGFELLAQVRADPELRNVPVMLLSARAGEEAKVEGLRIGADDYLIKPFSARELLARVAANLELAGARSQNARLLGEEAQTLELLNRVGAAVSAEVDLERTVQVVTDAATELSGAAFGSFFYNSIDDKGEAYTLYTLSGAPREAFAGFPMPRNTAVFGPTFAGQGIVRSDDITADPRYGKNAPYYGMPKGHLPVRSYLAAPVLSRSGEVLGGLFFGHPEPGIFAERAERIVAAIAVQAGIAIDKARLYSAAQNEIARRKRVEEELRESERMLEQRVTERTQELLAEAKEREKAEGRFRLLVEGVVDYAIYMLDPTGIITNWNTGGERIKGYRSSEVIGRNFSRFFTPEDQAAGLPAKALAIAAKEGKYEGEGWRVRKDGTRFWANVVLDSIRGSDGTLIGFAKITRDVTERREATLALQKTQEQLAQAQKMEGIGHLTGGIAHDFNNLLTIIIGNVETLQRVTQNSGTDTARLSLAAENAMRGAQRAAALTQRLLAFARQQPLEPRTLDANRLVAGMSDLLRQSLGEEIATETVLAGGLWRVHIDPNQLEVAILNLAVNARDAMPEGGKITIETANAYLDEGYVADHAEVLPGQYVVICVTDTGRGMDQNTIERAFEPFFTTKDVGHGTGLGLSQVYGFVKQSGGHVKIYSEVGQGTTVKIYIPRLHASEETEAVTEPRMEAARSRASETILVVEDDEDVRRHTTEILRDLGYRTLEAGTGRAALQILHGHPEIQLLFTDVGLPGGMNGRQLAEEVSRLHADIKVLMTTGYARNAIVHDGRLDPGVQLITKPFTYAALAAKIRSILDTPARSGHILLVEDEVLIQMVAVEQLRSLGFKVETAGSATEAMSKLKLTGDIAAAIIDVGLPDRKGDVLVGEVRAIYPSMPIVIASGYGRDALLQRFKNDDRIGVMSKPYGTEQLRAALAAFNVTGKPST